jgi:hypothetical protein
MELKFHWQTLCLLLIFEVVWTVTFGKFNVYAKTFKLFSDVVNIIIF